MNGGEYYRKRAMKRLIAAGIFIVVAGVGLWYFANTGSFQKVAALESSAEHLAAQEISKNFSAPTPLVATGTTPTAGGTGGATGKNRYTLTRSGISSDTNAARAENGNLPPLAENTTLDDIAQIRLDDMFEKQYFAHVSPASSSAVTVAQAVGYDYIELGENLALGDFVGDQGVVTAWMNSPGHRANILNTHYTQIGVAARQGIFDGQEAWIAVQVFGRPLGDCPAPDAALKAQVDAEQSQLTIMAAQLQTMKAQTDQTDPNSVNDYNTLVNQYDALAAQAKSDVTQYNTEVNTYNQCLQG
jgi:uncharacterized protein YkwD